MKRRGKKILGFALTLGMLIGFMSVPVNAAEQQPSEPVALSETPQVNQLAVYPDPPEGTARFSAYDAQVRSPEGTYSDLYTYSAKMGNFDTGDPGNSNIQTGFVMFDCAGRVEMQITYNGGPLTSAKVWPEAFGIEPEIDGQVMTLSFDGPKNFVLEVNGNEYNALHIFSNPMEENVPSQDDPDVMYFGAGLHEYGNDDRITRESVKAHQSSKMTTQDFIDVPSGKTVYIAPGAVVKAQIRTNPYFSDPNWENVSRKKDITIRGRGVIDCSKWCGDFTNSARAENPELPGIVVFTSDNVTVEGLVIVNPERQSLNVTNCNNITVDNVKGFTSMEEGDGIVLVMQNKDVTVKNCFVRTSDDSLVTGAHSENILWENNVVANMRVHSLMVNAANLKNYKAKDIYIINSNAYPGLRGTIGVYGGGSGVDGVTFENVEIERSKNGCMLEMYTHAMWTSSIGDIKNVVFNNVNYNTKYNYNEYWSPIGGGNANKSTTEDEAKETIDGVQFNNCHVDGKLVTDSESGRLSIGSYASDITFNGVPHSDKLTSSPDIVPTVTEREGKYYRIYNRVQSGKCLYDNNGIVELGEGTGYAYQWSLEDQDGFIRFRNRKTGNYINIEANDGEVHAGEASGQSADWMPVGSEHGYFQLRNRLYGLNHIHAQNGKLEAGRIRGGDWKGDMWEFVEQNNYEAEEAELSGGVKTDDSYQNYSGTGLVNGYENPGASTTFTVNTKTADKYDLHLRYANATGEAKTLSLYVNGSKIKQITLPNMSDWNTWNIVTTKVNLKEDVNTIEYKYDENDSGNVNLDYIELAVPLKYEAEKTHLSGSVKVESDDFRKYVTGYENYGDATTFTVNNPTDLKAGYSMTIKYANPTDETKTLSLYMNDVKVMKVDLPTTETWSNKNITVALNPGNNKISLVCDDLDSGNVNLDYIVLERKSVNPDLPSVRAKAYMLDGTASNGKSAANMVDGDMGTYAQANTNALWKPLIDLGAVYNINSVEINTDEWNYATSYEIRVSTDNVNWTTVATEINRSFGRNITTFEMTQARYVKVNVTAVNGGGDTWGHAIYEIVIDTYEIETQDKELTKVIAPEAISGLPNGTEKTAEAIGLPATVKIVTDDGSESDVEVIWNLDSTQYDPTVETAQNFIVSGEVQLPEGVVNTNNVPLTVSVDVTVDAAPVDKSMLTEKIEAAEALNAADYTESTWAVLEGALEVAKTVNKKEDAIQEEVDAAVSTLEAAIDGLETAVQPEPVIDKLLAKALYSAYKDLDITRYTQDSAAAFTEALGGLQTVIEKENATQEEIDNSIANLLLAATTLTVMPEDPGEPEVPVDFSVLSVLYNAYTGIDTAKYTKESTDAFLAAFQGAKEVLDSADADQTAVDQAASRLMSAATALEMKPVETPKPVVPALKKGQILTYKGLRYKVTNPTAGKATVMVVGASSKSVKKVTVPSTVTLKGVKCKVTKIGQKAFKNYTKLQRITIGANVTAIGQQAFYGDSKLTYLSVKTKVLKNAYSKSLKGISPKAVINVPNSKVGAYKKVFKNRGQKSSVVIK